MSKQATECICGKDGHPINSMACPVHGTWRPITTAPKMKSVLLFAVTDIAEDGRVRNWKMGTGFWHSGYEAWEWEGRILRSYDVNPTHWHPLPRPPSERGADVEAKTDAS